MRKKIKLLDGSLSYPIEKKGYKLNTNLWTGEILIKNPQVIEDIHVDLGEVQGFKYHNGVVFSAYSNEAGYVLSKGGRYDGLRKADNESRPAVGFDLDLIAVTNL